MLRYKKKWPQNPHCGIKTWYKDQHYYLFELVTASATNSKIRSTAASQITEVVSRVKHTPSKYKLPE